MPLFSSRQSTPMSESPPTSSAVDALGRLVRMWGRHAFDTHESSAETFGAECEGWARNILTGAPRPDGGSGSNVQHGRYADLLLWLYNHRRRERDYVDDVKRGLKNALRDVIHQFQASVHAHTREDQKLQAQLGRLEELLNSNDIRELRRVAAETAQAVSNSIVARQERDAHQLGVLTNRMESLESTLVEVRAQTETDALTGLKNRGALDQDLPQRVLEASRVGQTLSILMVDIDHFKRVNDTYGHPVGDGVIRAVADALVRAFPRRDDYIARYGGEEFCVVLSNTARSDAKRLSERFLAELRKRPVRVDGHELAITASVGLTAITSTEAKQTVSTSSMPRSLAEATRAATDAIARADQALYRAKREGRDRVEVGPEV